MAFDDPTKSPTLSERPDLDALLAFWQPLVRLADWDITIKYERHLDRTGWCHVGLDYKRASIRIMDPIDWPDRDRAYDVEKAVVHELLHPHFGAFKTENGSPQGTAEEQAVESLARAFVELRRMQAIPAVSTKKMSR